MNVFIYSGDRVLLSELSDALRNAGETPFLVPDFKTLQSLVTHINPDIAFLDEALFPLEKIEKVQNHIFDIFLDFPVTSITNPFYTSYRGRVSEQKFNKLAQLVSETAKKHTNKDNMSPKLSELFSFLLQHKDEKIETAEMMNHLWNDCSATHKKTLHTYICKLREKLTETGNTCTLEKVAKSTYSLKSKAPSPVI